MIWGYPQSFGNIHIAFSTTKTCQFHCRNPNTLQAPAPRRHFGCSSGWPGRVFSWVLDGLLVDFAVLVLVCTKYSPGRRGNQSFHPQSAFKLEFCAVILKLQAANLKIPSRSLKFKPQKEYIIQRWFSGQCCRVWRKNIKKNHLRNHWTVAVMLTTSSGHCIQCSLSKPSHQVDHPNSWFPWLKDSPNHQGGKTRSAKTPKMLVNHHHLP